jgi:ADP-heptose:LPS heptosyltransferase
VDQHPGLANLSIEWLISKGLEPLMDAAEPHRQYTAIAGAFTWKTFWSLVRSLRQKQFDKVILFFAPWWVGLACFLARIPERFSPRSRWYQLLFFNKTLKQNRSRSEKHEADYNWDLLHWALTSDKVADQLPTPFLYLKGRPAEDVQLPKNYYVIHPGMGGSALNWPPDHYLKLAELIGDAGFDVIITGTNGDLPWLTQIEKPLRQRPYVHWLVGQLNLQNLIYVLSQSRACIAPSTGVIHLAASSGVKTIGIYSPIKVQTPTRWSPRGPKAIAFAPQVDCPAQRHCLESRCKEYPCMTRVTPDEIFSEALKA